LAKYEVLQQILRSYEQPDEAIRWPKDKEERLRVCLSLLGFKVAQTFDFWIDWAMEFVRNPTASPEYRRNHYDWEREQRYRDAFAGLTSDQTDSVEQLFLNMARGLLHSFLVDLDRCPEVSTDIIFKRLESDEVLASLRRDDLRDFQAHLFDWLGRFSDRAPLLSTPEAKGSA
jgi:hypothetical protein